MSGTSFDTQCPICKESMNVYSDYKPFEYSSGECLNCGFYFSPKAGQMTLEDINEQRLDNNESNGIEEGDDDYLKPLTQEDLDKYKEEINNL